MNVRSPSLLQVTRPSDIPVINKFQHKCPRHIALSLADNKKTGLGSQVSLYSSSSEEPTAYRNKQNRHDHIGKTTSIKESRVQKRFTHRKHNTCKNNKSESESECKVVKQSSRSGHKPLPNSISRSRLATKQALTKSLKEQSHSRTIRMKEPNLSEPPDYYMLTYCKSNDRQHVCDSPPIPTIARKLAQGQQTYINNIHDQSKTSNIKQSSSNNQQQRQDHLPALASPPPSLSHNHFTNSTVPVLPQINSHKVIKTLINTSEIERAPSCSPDTQPLDKQDNIPSVLPLVQELNSRDDSRNDTCNNEVRHEIVNSKYNSS